MKLFILLLATFCSVQSVEFEFGDNGQVLWSSSCDINGTVIGIVKISDRNCGGACLENPNCTSFSWTSLDGGTCSLKVGGEAHYDFGSMCGKVVDRTTSVKILIQLN